MNTFKFTIITFILLIMSACTTETAENTPTSIPAAKEDTSPKNQTVQTPNANYHIFQSKAKPYTMQIPVEWLIKEHTKSGALTVKEPAKDTIDYRATIQLNARKVRMAYSEEEQKMVAQPMELKEALDSYTEGLKRSYEEMNIEDTQEMKVGGEAAIVSTYTYQKESEFENPIKSQTYLFYHDSEAYILTFKEEAAGFEAMQPIFEEIKNSFKFQ